MSKKRLESRLLLPEERNFSRRNFFLGLLGMGSLTAYSTTLLSQFTQLPHLWQDFPVASNFLLQSSYQGKIMSLHTARYRPEERAEEFKAVSEFFDVPVHVYVDTDFNSNAGLVNVRPISHTANKWMRDLLLFTRDGKAIMNFFVEKRELGKQLRETAAYLQDDGLDVILSPFRFEGGQILQVGKTTLMPEHFNDPRNFPGLRLINEPYIQERFGEYGLYQENCEELYEYILNGDVEFMPTGLEMTILAGHIDMTTTPCNDRKIIVGDVALAQTILNDISEEKILSYEQELSRIVQAENRKDMSTSQKRNYTNSVDQINLRGSSRTKIGKMLEKECDATAQYLERIGFSVRRIPLFASEFSYSGDEIVLTYNNVLLEQGTGKALIPTFGIPELDEEAQQIFRDEGYHSQLLIDSRKDLAGKSGPHCNYNEQREKIT